MTTEPSFNPESKPAQESLPVACGPAPGRDLPGWKARFFHLAYSPSPFRRRLYTVLHLLGTLRRPIAQRRLRSELLTRLRYGQNHFQGSTYTQENRFPDLFEQCRLALQPVEQPHILSFGCSTGEEVFTLARYLPEARITGVDLNRWCLTQCMERNQSPRIDFLHSLSPEFAALNGLDAIFCLSVFQRTENAHTSKDGVRSGFGFRQFAEAVASLDRRLKIGGLLFLDQADFAFADTPTAVRYRPLGSAGSPVTRERALFGPDNTLKAARTVSPRAYLKLRNG